MFNSKRHAAIWQEDAALYAQWAREALSAGKIQLAISYQRISAYYAQLARGEMNIAACPPPFRRYPITISTEDE